MGFFAVGYEYVSDADKVAAVRPKHREFLNGLHEQGLLVASGPLIDTSPAAALLIMRADSADRLAEALDADPFNDENLITRRTITPWNPAVGIFADAD